MPKWWSKESEKSERIHLNLFDAISGLQNQIDARRQRAITNLSLYLGRRLPDTYFDGGAPDSNFNQINMNINAIRSLVDTIASHITVNMPRPQFLTDDGDASQRARAKGLDKYMSGIFADSDVYAKAHLVFLDAAIFDTGFLIPHVENEKILIDRIFPLEVIVDQATCVHGEMPRQFYRVRRVDRDALTVMFPKKKEIIGRSAGDTSIISITSSGSPSVVTDERVELIEAWHLPVCDEPGRYVMSVVGGVLQDEEYNYPGPPWVAYRIHDLPVGYYGQSIVENVQGPQMDYNHIADRVRKSINLHATTWVFMEKGTVNVRHLKNEPGNIVEVDPSCQRWPQVVAPPSMNSEVYNYLEDKHTKIFEQEGVSRFAATGEKPAEVESGKAFRTLKQVTMARLARPAFNWDQLFPALAEATIREAKRLAESGTDPEVKFIQKDSFVRLKWSDVDMERDKFVIRVYPTNLLPTEPAGKLDTVERLMNMQVIADPAIARDLLSFPDLEKFNNMESAAFEDIDRVIEYALTKNEYIPPEKYQNLQYGLARITSAILRARAGNAPEERIAHLETWLADATDVLEQIEREQMEKQQAMQAAQQPPPGPPQGPSEATTNGVPAQ